MTKDRKNRHHATSLRQRAAAEIDTGMLGQP
jgi:hypothetical protein